MNRLPLIIAILLFQISTGQECLNVKFKLRGYFYVGTSKTDTTALGGFYEDKNIPKQLTSNIVEYSAPKELKVIVRTDMTSEFEKGVLGFKVFVINTSDSLIGLPAQDSRLYLKRQVFYRNEWRDVEYLPNSWCGNSYHNVFIKPNEYWDLVAPCITGAIKAKFRFQLLVNEQTVIYSNAFDGSFNKKQLHKEQGYRPVSIMDPYNN